MERPSGLPPGSIEIRAVDANGRSHFLGGVDARRRVHFHHRGSRQCYVVTLAELTAVAARLAGCSHRQLLEELDRELELVSGPCGPRRVSVSGPRGLGESKKHAAALWGRSGG